MPSTTPCFSMNSVQLLRTWGTVKQKQRQFIIFNLCWAAGQKKMPGYWGWTNFFVFSDGKTPSELEWTHTHTESCISWPGCLKTLSVLMQAVCKETVSVWGNQSPSQWLCGRQLKSRKSLVSPHSPSGAMHNTDMLFVYVSVSMEDKDSVYMYEEASPQLTHHFRLTEWDTCWSSCSNSTCSQRENKAIHSMWTNKRIFYRTGEDRVGRTCYKYLFPQRCTACV